MRLNDDAQRAYSVQDYAAQPAIQGVELVDLIPRRLGEAMASGELDAGPLSLMDYVRLESRLVPLPYGIGCPTGARSVLVFSDRPLSALTGAQVGITITTLVVGYLAQPFGAQARDPGVCADEVRRDAVPRPRAR